MMKKDLDQFKERADANGNLSTTSEELKDMKAKQMVLASSIQPDTGEVTPYPARISAFVTTNIPIICGMMLAKPTTFNILSW